MILGLFYNPTPLVSFDDCSLDESLRAIANVYRRDQQASDALTPVGCTLAASIGRQATGVGERDSCGSCV